MRTAIRPGHWGQLGLLLLYLLLHVLPASAVHLLGGEMSYKYLDATGPLGKPWRYEITIRVYFNPITDPAEQQGLTIRVFDNNVRYDKPLQTAVVQRSSTTVTTIPTLPGCGLPAPPTAIALYVTTINLPAFESGFWASCSANDRIAGITNLEQSVKVGMQLAMEIAPATIPNAAPVFSNVPVSLICLGTPSFVANNAYDADGDELAYEFSEPLDANGQPVVYAPYYNAAYPFGYQGNFNLDATTGRCTYLGLTQGIFQLAIDVLEYRTVNGQRRQLSRVHRDMQVVVRACAGGPNQPPAFAAPTPVPAQRTYQLTEGQSLSFEVAATDPDGDPLALTASSALLDGPGGIEATFGGQPGMVIEANPVGQATIKGRGRVAGVFQLTGCGANRRVPYEVQITASDDVCNSQTVVATFLVMVIRPEFAGTVQGSSLACAQGTATYAVANSTYSAYNWTVTGGQVLGPATGPSVEVLWAGTSAGVVQVTGVTASGCPTQPLAYPVSIGAGLAVSGPTTYCLTAATNLRYRVQGLPGTYQWTVANGTIVQGQGTNEVLLNVWPGTTARLQVGNTDLTACAATLLVAPDDSCLNFYNVFTPNGDAKNDLFIIENIERYPHTALTIFNRWGRPVYHSDDYLNTYDGGSTSAGTYYYRCQLANGTTYKGWFELIR